MMAGDDFDKLRRQVPVAGNDVAAFALGDAEYLLLGLLQRYPLRTGLLVRSAEVMRRGPQQRHNANIMQQHSRISFSRIGKRDFGSEFASYQRTAEGVRPENGWTHAERDC